MTSRRKIKVVLVLIVVVALFALLWHGVAPREPIYNGKPLTYWLDQAYGGFNWTEQGAYDAHEAILAAGTNTIPILLQNLKVRNLPLLDSVTRFLKKSYSGSSAYVPPSGKYEEAARGFEVLGDRAKDSVPSLIRIYERNVSAGSRSAALRCLGFVGPGACAAVPTLLATLTNSDGWLCLIAANALGDVHSEPEMVVPALTKCAGSNYAMLSMESLKALEKFGPEAKSAIPTVTDVLNDRQINRSIRQQAFKTIQAIAPDTAVKSPPELFEDFE